MGELRVSKKPQTVKMRIKNHVEKCVIRNMQAETLVPEKHRKPQRLKHFDLLRKPNSTVPYVRRRVRFACLCGSFDLCQLVKKEFFGKLGRLCRLKQNLFSLSISFFSFFSISFCQGGSPSLTVSGPSSIVQERFLFLPCALFLSVCFYKTYVRL